MLKFDPLQDASIQVSVFDQLVLRRRLLINTNKSSLILNYVPLKDDVKPRFNKFESPLPNNAFCKVWLKLAHAVVLEKK